jgi:hypothetical protein
LKPIDTNEKLVKKVLNQNVFSNICNYEYLWQKEYSTNEYLNLLSTYSDHIALSIESRNQLFDELREMINTKYNGKIIKDYMTILEIGKKKL